MRSFILLAAAAILACGDDGGANAGAGAGVRTLTVSVSGSGAVTSTPAGIACGAACSAQFAAGSTVGLIAQPAAGWRFKSWGGACSGTAGCELTMSADTSVTAAFEATAYTLSVSVQGSGTVASVPLGILCRNACSAQFAPGTKVEIDAEPDDGWHLSSWSAPCVGGGTCILIINSDVSVTATFTRIEKQFTVAVVLSGNGSGKITSTPPGISCPPACSMRVWDGTTVNLGADPDPGSFFGGWGGDRCRGSGGCIFTVSGDVTVPATFTLAGARPRPQ